MNRLLADNPVLIKHIRIRLRRPQAIYLGIVVLSLCLCVMWAGWKLNGLDNGTVFSILVWSMGGVLQLVGTSQVTSSISQTNETGILDFHRIAPLPPHTTALGFVLGGPVREYLIAGMIFPFALFCALAGEPGLSGFAAISIVMLSTTLLFHMLAMNAGLLAKRGKTRGRSMGLAFLLVMASFSTGTVLAGLPIPGLLTVGPTYIEAMGGNRLLNATLPTFFGLKLPLFVQSLIYQIPLIVFLSIPIVRRMRSAQASLYSKPAAIGCLAAISVLNLGGIVKHPQLEATTFVPMLLYFSVIVSILLTLAVTPSRSRYLNLVRRSKKLNMLKPSLWQDDSSSRAVLFIFGSFVWATVQLADTFIAGKAIGQDFLVMTGTAVCVVIYFGSALQFFALKFGHRSRPVLMLFLFLFWLMPLAIAALALSTNHPELAPLIAAMSPIFGIGSGSIPGLIAAVVLGAIFFSLSVREELRIQTEFAGDPFEEEDDEPEVHDEVVEFGNS